MRNSILLGLLLSLSLGLAGCDNTEIDPNIVYNDKQQSPLDTLQTDDTIGNDLPYQQMFYVPVYSDIYVDEGNPKVLLSATLSIRNTSLQDSFYVTKIDYYNTEGKFVRHYLEKSIELPPMGTLNYIVEKHDDTGGSGANFVLNVESSAADIKPLIESVMIGSFSNKALAFRSPALAMTDMTDMTDMTATNPVGISKQ